MAVEKKRRRSDPYWFLMMHSFESSFVEVELLDNDGANILDNDGAQILDNDQ